MASGLRNLAYSAATLVEGLDQRSGVDPLIRKQATRSAHGTHVRTRVQRGEAVGASWLGELRDAQVGQKQLEQVDLCNRRTEEMGALL